MSENNKHVLYWVGRGFGEPLILSLVAKILRDNNIDAYYKESRKTQGLTDDALQINFNDSSCAYHTWSYDIKNSKSIMQQYIDHYSDVFNKKIEITRNYIPVKYHDIANTQAYDVAIHSQTGDWTPYRNWPYFAVLKILLAKDKISYIDLAEKRIYGIEYLNYVNKAKVYLGLETGPSHYVSQFAKNKCLILQGGFSTFDFWASSYCYERIQIDDVACRPCFISWKDIVAGNKCKSCNKCMFEIDPIAVFEKIREMLK